MNHRSPAHPSPSVSLLRRPWRPGLAKSLLASWLLVASALLGTPAIAQESSPEDEPFSYTQLLASIEENQVASIDYDPATDKVMVEFVDPSRPPREVEVLDDNPELIRRAREQGVEFNVTPSSDRSAVLGLFVNILLLFLLRSRSRSCAARLPPQAKRSILANPAPASKWRRKRAFFSTM